MQHARVMGARGRSVSHGGGHAVLSCMAARTMPTALPEFLPALTCPRLLLLDKLERGALARLPNGRVSGVYALMRLCLCCPSPPPGVRAAEIGISAAAGASGQNNAATRPSQERAWAGHATDAGAGGMREREQRGGLPACFHGKGRVLLVACCESRQVSTRRVHFQGVFDAALRFQPPLLFRRQAQAGPGPDDGGAFDHPRQHAAAAEAGRRTREQQQHRWSETARHVRPRTARHPVLRGPRVLTLQRHLLTALLRHRRKGGPGVERRSAHALGPQARLRTAHRPRHRGATTLLCLYAESSWAGRYAFFRDPNVPHCNLRERLTAIILDHFHNF